MRVGIGYDVHKLVDDRELVLGGVNIPHSLGLLGHSDADVLVHAIIDSILGAAGLGDIGKLFPDSDNKYKDISSIFLLQEVSKLISKEGYAVGNIDATIIAQKPKLLNYIPEMKKNIARALDLSDDLVNIKATTEEWLGFTGREEGIASQSICMLIPFELISVDVSYEHKGCSGCTGCKHK